MKDELIKMIQNALSGRISFLFAELCDDIEDYAGHENEDVEIQECKDSFGRKLAAAMDAYNSAIEKVE